MNVELGFILIKYSLMKKISFFIFFPQLPNKSMETLIWQVLIALKEYIGLYEEIRKLQILHETVGQ